MTNDELAEIESAVKLYDQAARYHGQFPSEVSRLVLAVVRRRIQELLTRPAVRPAR